MADTNALCKTVTLYLVKPGTVSKRMYGQAFMHTLHIKDIYTLLYRLVQSSKNQHVVLEIFLKPGLKNVRVSPVSITL